MAKDQFMNADQSVYGKPSKPLKVIHRILYRFSYLRVFIYELSRL
jgi:hypothetical protein